MFIRAGILILLIIFWDKTNAQHNEHKTIYLGPEMAEKFDVSMTFFDYKLKRYEIVESNVENKMNRPGIILDAKSKDEENSNIVAVYGNGKDSCFLLFHKKILYITEGRSALTSILNLFSKSEDKVPQDEPFTYTSDYEYFGSIKSDSVKASFFIQSIKKKFICWVAIESDTFFYSPDKEITNKKGTIKKSSSVFYQGFLLMNKENIAAGYDGYWPHHHLYLSKDLSANHKLILNAFCYMLLKLL